MSEKVFVVEKSAKVKNPFKKCGYILKIICWLIMLFVVSELLIDLNNEGIITNWGIGLIGMVVFGIFYCIDNVRFVLFRINKFNFFMISFFLAWLVADWEDFILMVVEIVIGLFGG